MDESAADYDVRMASRPPATPLAELREFSASQNGDRWFVGRNRKTLNGYILHKANEPSGGACTEMEIGAFLQRTSSGAPEYEAFVRLIDNLVGASV
jgi:hypothetical protein